MRYTDGYFLEIRIVDGAQSRGLILFLSANKGTILKIFNWLS